MRLERVEQYGITITFTGDDCALMAYLLEVASDHAGHYRERPLPTAWMDTATVAFEAGALVCNAASLMLDTVDLRVTAEDRAGFAVEAIRHASKALVETATPGLTAD